MDESTLETVLGCVAGFFIGFMVLCALVRVANDFVYSLFGVDIVEFVKRRFAKKSGGGRKPTSQGCGQD